MFDLFVFDRTAGDESCYRNPVGGENRACHIGVGHPSYPVHGFIDRHLYGSVDVMGIYPRYPEESDEQAGGVHVIANL